MRQPRRRSLKYRENEQLRCNYQGNDHRENERERNICAMALRRNNRILLQAERRRDAVVNANQIYPKNEQGRNTNEHNRRRQDEGYWQLERGKDAAARATRRTSRLYHSVEQFRNTEEHIVSRENQTYREHEQRADSNIRRSARLNIDYRQREQSKNTSQRRKYIRSIRTLDGRLIEINNRKVQLHTSIPEKWTTIRSLTILRISVRAYGCALLIEYLSSVLSLLFIQKFSAYGKRYFNAALE
uniref:Uncharacterized protein n=1 Tax=Glossina brevipalpis TaxID=37001 RepID=A0A1A9X2S6_9MUSC